MKKSVIAALTTSAAVAILAVPAGAAVPKTNPTATVVCDEAGHMAKVWIFPNRAAVDASSCSGWVGLIDGDSLIAVAPGAHFHRHGGFGGQLRSISPSTMCNGDWDDAVVVWPGHHGRFEEPACRN